MAGSPRPSALLGGTGSGPDKARQQGPHAHQVVFDPSNHFLLEADLGLDKILVYRFDAAIGKVWRPTILPSVSWRPAPGRGISRSIRTAGSCSRSTSWPRR